MKLLYNALLHPYYIYGIIVWGAASDLALDKIVKLQKRAIRMLSNTSYRAHTDPLFFSNSLLKLKDLYRKEIAIFMYKAKFGLLPICCSSYVKKYSPRPHSLRVIYDFELQYTRTTARQNFITWSGPTIWNSIPNEIKNAPSLSIFKRDLTTFLINQYNL